MIYTNEMIKKKNEQKKKIKKITNIIYILVVIMIFSVVAYVAYYKYVKKENNIKLLGVKQYVVMTGSMQPKYNIGDIIIDKEIKKEEIKEGDVITYSLGDGEHTVSHRIIKIIEKDGETLYQTKGDNNNTPDKELVKYSQIQGKAIFKLNKMGIILKSFTTGTAIAIIMLIFIVCYFKSSIKDDKIYKREEARKKYNIPKYKTTNT